MKMPMGMKTGGMKAKASKRGTKKKGSKAKKGGKKKGSPSSDGDMSAFMAEMNTMMKTMPPSKGSTDRNFAAQMTNHHQAAIAMAKTEVKDGKDPTMKRLAAHIVKVQKPQMAIMKNYLKRSRPK